MSLFLQLILMPIIGCMMLVFSYLPLMSLKELRRLGSKEWPSFAGFCFLWMLLESGLLLGLTWTFLSEESWLKMRGEIALWMSIVVALLLMSILIWWIGKILNAWCTHWLLSDMH